MFGHDMLGESFLRLWFKTAEFAFLFTLVRFFDMPLQILRGRRSVWAIRAPDVTYRAVPFHYVSLQRTIPAGGEVALLTREPLASTLELRMSVVICCLGKYFLFFLNPLTKVRRGNAKLYLHGPVGGLAVFDQVLLHALDDTCSFCEGIRFS